MTAPPDLIAAGRRAFRPRTRRTVSEWADQNVVLGEQNAEPGPWRTARTPYLREIMDSIGDRHVEQVTMMTSTQVGKTSALLNGMGYCVDEDPGPTMFVMPREEDRDYLVAQRVKPMIAESEALRGRMTGRDWDSTKECITFDRASVYFVGANSPAGLSSKPIRTLIGDELDKWPPFSGREADPWSLATERTRTFWNRKIVCCSTPTTKAGLIWREFQRSDQRHYHVPCPHCGRYQVLAMSSITWPEEERDPDRVRQDNLASYHCVACAADIRDREKSRMLLRGVWVPEGCEIRPDGTVSGNTRGTHRGYHLSALYSPFLTWSEIAAKWLDAQGDVARLLNFVNSWLGEPWEEKVSEIKEERLSALSLPYAPCTVPAGAIVLTAGVDVQADLFYYVIRAWGAGEESWLVKAGKETRFDALAEAVLDTSFPGVDGSGIHTVQRMCIDSGYRTDEVYDFARSRSEMVYPTKGRDMLTGGLPYQAVKIERNPFSGSAFVGSIVLWHVNTHFFKDRFTRYLQPLEDGSPARWHVHQSPAPDYLRQIASEHKIIVRDTRLRSGMTTAWKKKPGHNQNHYLDCYSSDTEVLTRDGWIQFANASRSDVFATVNLETRALEYQKATNFIRRRHDGDMIQAGAEPRSRVNLLVTPGHRMIGYRHSNDHTPGVFTAEEMTPSCRLLTGAKWHGERRGETCRIPKVGRMPAVTVSAADLAEFFGWYLSEGTKFSDGKGRRVTLYQNRGLKREEMKELLDRLPWKYFEHDRGVTISNGQAYACVEHCGWTRTKRVPEWIKLSKPNVIQAFLRSAVLGDGWVDKDSGGRRYATVSKSLADDISELFIKGGGWPVTHVRAPKPYSIQGRSGHNTRTQYWVMERLPASVHMRNSKGEPNFKRVHYKGEIACATVPNGTLIVRRGGKVVVCGNCEVQALVAAHMRGVFDSRLRPAPGAPDPVPESAAPRRERDGERRRRGLGAGGSAWFGGSRRRR